LNNGEFKSAVKEYELIKENKEAESIRIMFYMFFISCLKNARTELEGQKFDKILDIANVPIYVSGKLGDSLLVHYMYKITKIVKDFKRERK
jgi:hypothetical protein